MPLAEAGSHVPTRHGARCRGASRCKRANAPEMAASGQRTAVREARSRGQVRPQGSGGVHRGRSPMVDVGFVARRGAECWRVIRERCCAPSPEPQCRRRRSWRVGQLQTSTGRPATRRSERCGRARDSGPTWIRNGWAGRKPVRNRGVRRGERGLATSWRQRRGVVVGTRAGAIVQRGLLRGSCGIALIRPFPVCPAPGSHKSARGPRNAR